MEDLVGIIIYLILAIVGIMAGIYRQKNKQKRVKTPPVESAPVETGPAESFETEFDPFAGLFEEKPAVEEAEYVVAEDKEENEDEIKVEKADEKHYVEGEAVFDVTKDSLISDDTTYESPDVYKEAEHGPGLSIMETEKTEMTEHSESAEYKEIFDLRKAVIYSEILNRKEY